MEEVFLYAVHLLVWSADGTLHFILFNNTPRFNLPGIFVDSLQMLRKKALKKHWLKRSSCLYKCIQCKLLDALTVNIIPFISD